MEKLLIAAQDFARDEEGVTAIEYGLIASLIAVAIIAGATVLGDALDKIFTDIAALLVLK